MLVEISEGTIVGEDVMVAVGGMGVLVGSGTIVAVAVNCRVGTSGDGVGMAPWGCTARGKKSCEDSQEKYKTAPVF